MIDTKPGSAVENVAEAMKMPKCRMAPMASRRQWISMMKMTAEGRVEDCTVMKLLAAAAMDVVVVTEILAKVVKAADDTDEMSLPLLTS